MSHVPELRPFNVTGPRTPVFHVSKCRPTFWMFETEEEKVLTLRSLYVYSLTISCWLGKYWPEAQQLHSILTVCWCQPSASLYYYMIILDSLMIHTPTLYYRQTITKVTHVMYWDFRYRKDIAFWDLGRTWSTCEFTIDENMHCMSCWPYVEHGILAAPQKRFVRTYRDAERLRRSGKWNCKHTTVRCIKGLMMLMRCKSEAALTLSCTTNSPKNL